MTPEHFDSASVAPDFVSVTFAVAAASEAESTQRSAASYRLVETAYETVAAAAALAAASPSSIAPAV